MHKRHFDGNRDEYIQFREEYTYKGFSKNTYM